MAYTDKDADQFYWLGEGRGDLVAKIGTTSVTSYASGGYNLVVNSGENPITYTGGSLTGALTVKTTIGTGEH